ncbi:MAG: ABC transporter permease [Lentimicrobiaceae bacterium]|jgi:ABC-2 type transport system permease protein|nr:ABC transporter permease [Lentimicrobiaceae bacterium]MDD4598378.1 ABC transporter permease [Lentimicrobiaceae bacterium]MDY0025593.1 ABC transporter permease [Lentimicrobium sp.]HAH59512.1 ABC transporter permease [Bacteroidales bacterium]
MRKVFYIVRKEFLQVFRNRMMLPIIFVMPLAQLLILAYAVTYEIKHIDLFICDIDNTMISREFTGHFIHSPFYNVKYQERSISKGMDELRKGKVHQMIVILPGFEKALNQGRPVRVQVINDAINSSAAALMNAYTLSIIQHFNRNNIEAHFITRGTPAQVNLEYSYWFNPDLNYKTFMVPGILVLLVTLIGMFLSGMNVVREKEIGTIEQINVTPLRKTQFIAGKLIPFWIIGLLELAFGLVLARLFFNIPILGNIPLIFMVAAVFLLVVTGLGLLISTLVNTQQQSMFISWFILVIFILLSGLFTPIESMPQWAKVLTFLNPIAHFIEIMRLVMLKGAGLKHILQPLGVLVLYAAVILSLAIKKYRKTT